jgi:type II secretory pathway component GspD/PulD (secretin)
MRAPVRRGVVATRCKTSITVIVFSVLFSSLAFGRDFKSMTLYDLGLEVSKQTGYTLLFSPRVRSNRKVSVYSSEELAGKELYQVFLSVLKGHGYTGVRQGNLVRIVRTRKARSLAAPVVTP